MKKEINRRNLIKLSAMIPGLASIPLSIFSAQWLLEKYFNTNLFGLQESLGMYGGRHTLFFLGCYWFLIFHLFLYLWKRFLISVGALTNEESAGYPYTEDWGFSFKRTASMDKPKEDEIPIICPKCNEGKMYFDSNESKMFVCDKCHSAIENKTFMLLATKTVLKKRLVFMVLVVVVIIIMWVSFYNYVKDF